MADQKTTATDQSVADHLAALPNDQQRQIVRRWLRFYAV